MVEHVRITVHLYGYTVLIAVGPQCRQRTLDDFEGVRYSCKTDLWTRDITVSSHKPLPPAPPSGNDELN